MASMQLHFRRNPVGLFGGVFLVNEDKDVKVMLIESAPREICIELCEGLIDAGIVVDMHPHSDPLHEPRYIHDCQECIFLGLDNPDPNEVTLAGKVDLYIHVNKHNKSYSSLIRRYSSEGSDYGSLPVCAGTMRYGEVFKRAKEKELI